MMKPELLVGTEQSNTTEVRVVQSEAEARFSAHTCVGASVEEAKVTGSVTFTCILC